MQHRLVAIARHDGRFTPAVMVAVAAAWSAIGFASLSGLGAWLGHGHLIQGGLPIPLMLVSFTAGWAVMVVAMMVPAMPRPSRMSAGFVAGFLWVWLAFGLAALAFDAGVHWSFNHDVWLRAHAWVIQASLLGVAGAYQLSPVKAQLLERCSEPSRSRAIVGGWQAGGLSVGCCWALMLTGFAAGMTQLGWMIGLTLAMIVERDSMHRVDATRFTGLVLLALAAGIALASFWTAPTLFPA